MQLCRDWLTGRLPGERDLGDHHRQGNRNKETWNDNGSLAPGVPCALAPGMSPHSAEREAELGNRECQGRALAAGGRSGARWGRGSRERLSGARADAATRRPSGSCSATKPRARHGPDRGATRRAVPHTLVHLRRANAAPRRHRHRLLMARHPQELWVCGLNSSDRRGRPPASDLGDRPRAPAARTPRPIWARGRASGPAKQLGPGEERVTGGGARDAWFVHCQPAGLCLSFPGRTGVRSCLCQTRRDSAQRHAAPCRLWEGEWHLLERRSRCPGPSSRTAGITFLRPLPKGCPVSLTHLKGSLGMAPRLGEIWGEELFESPPRACMQRVCVRVCVHIGSCLEQQGSCA